MSETPKGEPVAGPKMDLDEKDSWEEDQKIRSYYYDDSCGYEIYVPEDDEPAESDDEIRPQAERPS